MDNPKKAAVAFEIYEDFKERYPDCIQRLAVKFLELLKKLKNIADVSAVFRAEFEKVVGEHLPPQKSPKNHLENADMRRKNDFLDALEYFLKFIPADKKAKFQKIIAFSKKETSVFEKNSTPAAAIKNLNDAELEALSIVKKMFLAQIDAAPFDADDCTRGENPKMAKENAKKRILKIMCLATLKTEFERFERQFRGRQKPKKPFWKRLF